MTKLYTAILAFVILLVLAFIGYGIYLNRESGSYIAMSMAQRVITVRGARVRHREIRPEITIDMVNLETRELVDAVSKVEGTIYDVQVNYGDTVKSGDLLCRVDNILVPIFAARSEMDILKARAAYIRDKNMLDRQRTLRSKNVITESDLEAAASQLAAAESELASAEVGHKEILEQQGNLDIIAPADGDILTIYHQAGSFVGKGTPVMMIGNFSRMFFRIDLPDRQIANIAPLDDGHEFFVDIVDDVRAFATNYTGGYGVDVTFRLGVAGISPPMSEAAPYRHVVCEIDNAKNVLEPGIYTDAVLRRRQPESLLVVPLSAVAEDGDGGTWVYVADGDSRLAKRNVELGKYDKRHVEVLRGLSDGEVVLVSGGGELPLGTSIAIVTDETE